ncbi:LacI family DNA-binding transcriptional regulator [Aliiglaciecola lipolytica]|uniref:LacI family transcription regulator n=1 Tax=Aliiglaciecola lipolytica E3 TaxID=1127673 RepID=K6YZK2_9ALTE|nr:LacI family DNA-binding transcriptional regulator [Aliiglaciecola lipolytica]GAC16645.1 LacI family transcription regulator [Aliiglaciecola lipolytica E3]
MTFKVRTLSDLAKLAGVSGSTASRALNDNPLISEKTRKKIQKLAADHGFKINTAARNFRLKTSNTIAVVIVKSSELDQSITDPFVLNIVGVIAEELRIHKYDVLLVSHNIGQAASLDEYFNMNRADGLIVFGQGDDIEAFDDLINKQHPIVVWGAQSNGNDYVTVGTDNVKGGELATQHLIEQGCQNIVFCGVRSFETGLRFEGYQNALKHAQLNIPDALDIHFTFEDAYRVTLELLKQNKFSFDGIVAASDTIALGMIRALNEQGISIPEQVAIVGYDDISVCAFTQPALSSIHQDTQLGGKALVSSLLDLLAKKPVESIMLDTQLVARDSSCRKLNKT